MRRTPALSADSLGPGAVVKPECLQRTGSFKLRGAYNAVAQLDPGDRARGVCAASSGNHAQAVALAARLHGVAATILMPHDAPASKVAGAVALGAQLRRYDRYTEDREALMRELASTEGLPAVHPFDDPRVMAGAGTLALELLEDAPGLETLVVPVGGGGCIAGCATAAEGRVRVVGVEPEAGDDTRQSLLTGERVRIPVPRTIADGLQLPTPGEQTFPVVRELVHDIVTVTDAEITGAMRWAFETLKLVVEPSGAVGIAAIRSGRVPGERAGIVVTGGNVDLGRFRELTA